MQDVEANGELREWRGAGGLRGAQERKARRTAAVQVEGQQRRRNMGLAEESDDDGDSFTVYVAFLGCHFIV